MAESARAGYLQARLQARHGQRPGEDEWRRIEASVDVLHYLDAVRQTPLKRWVRGVSPDSSSSEIERLLRANWRDVVEQSAAWAPKAWRGMLLWCRWLPDLPALAHLLGGGAVQPWMKKDPVIGRFALQPPTLCLAALNDTELAPMVSALSSGSDVREAWQAVFHDLLPRAASVATTAEIEQLVRIADHHDARMTEAPAEQDGQALRAELGERFERVFRRAAGTVAALFAFLGLEGLDAERVRAGLVTRRLLRRVPEGLTWA
ncbi:MAG: hypothetical protein EA419_00480 [Wenzhouxiangella sp.]|nr:MAG: hypothetical protein EA419_00480 [Wenzhouxiangella sp.]